MTYRKQRVFISTIHIPDGYKLLSRPEAIAIDNDDVKISYSFNKESDSSVKIVGIYDFKRDVYSSASYIDLKFYFKKIIEKFNEKVILAKKL